MTSGFGDLKSANDYLHVLRLRYDNRWLKAYWEGKLKEVEKEGNFFVSSIASRSLEDQHAPRSDYNPFDETDVNLHLPALKQLYKSGSPNQKETLLVPGVTVRRRFKAGVESQDVKLSSSIGSGIEGQAPLGVMVEGDLFLGEYRCVKSFYKKCAKIVEKHLPGSESSGDM